MHDLYHHDTIGGILPQEEQREGQNVTKKLVTFLCTAILLAPISASAWMFCWNSTATGIENCWGYPPYWYLHGGGPRTIVWLDGKLMDDTAWPAEKHLEAKRTVLNMVAAQANTRNATAQSQKARATTLLKFYGAYGKAMKENKAKQREQREDKVNKKLLDLFGDQIP